MTHGSQNRPNNVISLLETERIKKVPPLTELEVLVWMEKSKPLKEIQFVWVTCSFGVAFSDGLTRVPTVGNDACQPAHSSASLRGL